MHRARIDDVSSFFGQGRLLMFSAARCLFQLVSKFGRISRKLLKTGSTAEVVGFPVKIEDMFGSRPTRIPQTGSIAAFGWAQLPVRSFVLAYPCFHSALFRFWSLCLAPPATALTARSFSLIV
jgi:hypothetical protein